MADRITGLGQTLDEFQMMNGETTLGDVYAQVKKSLEGAKVERTRLNRVEVDTSGLWVGNTKVANLDDKGFEIIAKFFGIPVPYMMKLNRETRKANVDFWIDYYSDKEVEIVYRDNELMDMREGIKIEMVDVLEIVNVVFPDACIFKVTQQTNSTILDVYRDDLQFHTEYDTYLGGIRLVVKNGLAAPDISPMFLNVNSCAIIECSTYLEPLCIKNLSYVDILRVIRERVENCADALPSLFATYTGIASEKVTEPHRRIALYCREHNVPERVKAYALKEFDESGLQTATFEDIICLFSVLGYVDEVKQASEKKMQQLAGYIIVKAKGEKRCSHCDSMLISD